MTESAGPGDLPAAVVHGLISRGLTVATAESLTAGLLAATLAVLGYSVNESVVVFDRVRETFRKKRGLTTPQVLDHAITSTISRTIITHGSTQIMVLSMLPVLIA